MTVYFVPDGKVRPAAGQGAGVKILRWTVYALLGGVIAFLGVMHFLRGFAISSVLSDSIRPLFKAGDAIVSVPPSFRGQAVTTGAVCIRTSNTIFNINDPAPAWVLVGAASPVLSALPAGRFMQTKFVLSTANILATPVMQELRRYYYDWN